MMRARLLAVICGAWLLPTASLAIECGPEGGVTQNIRFVQQQTGVDFRQLVIAALGKVPEAGDALAAVTSFLWKAPESEASAAFDQMKEYVNQLVPELIEQQRVRDLEARLSGLHGVLNDYNRTSFGSVQKGQYFTSLLSLLDQTEPFFFDPHSPEKTLTYFVPLGTLKLFALSEQYLHYDKIYNQQDPDQATHLESLKMAVKNYSDALAKAQAAAVRWRVQDKIGLETRTESGGGVLGPNTTTIWTAKDRLCAWEVSFRHNPATGGDRYGEQNAQTELAQRRQQIEYAYTASLDVLLAPARFWSFLDPTNPNRPSRKPIAVLVPSGPYGGTSGASAFADDPKGQPITRVEVYAGRRVDGVAIRYGYDDSNTQLHGWRGGEAHILDLEPGETIVSARGRSGEAMDALYFKTSKGREVGGGAAGGNEWYASPPQGTKAALFKLSGYQGTRHLGGLTLTWRYFRQELDNKTKVCGAQDSAVSLVADDQAGLVYVKCTYVSSGLNSVRIEVVDAAGSVRRVANLPDEKSASFGQRMALDPATNTLYVPYWTWMPGVPGYKTGITALVLKDGQVKSRYTIDLPPNMGDPNAKIAFDRKRSEILIGVGMGSRPEDSTTKVVRINAATRTLVGNEGAQGNVYPVAFIATDDATGNWYFSQALAIRDVKETLIWRCEDLDLSCSFFPADQWFEPKAVVDPLTGALVVAAYDKGLLVLNLRNSLRPPLTPVPSGVKPYRVVAALGKAYVNEGFGDGSQIRVFDLSRVLDPKFKGRPDVGTFIVEGVAGGVMAINAATRTLYVVANGSELVELPIDDPPPYP